MSYLVLDVGRQQPGQAGGVFNFFDNEEVSKLHIVLPFALGYVPHFLTTHLLLGLVSSFCTEYVLPNKSIKESKSRILGVFWGKPESPHCPPHYSMDSACSDKYALSGMYPIKDTKE